MRLEENYRFLFVQNQRNLQKKWIKWLMISTNCNIEIQRLMIVFKLTLYIDY